MYIDEIKQIQAEITKIAEKYEIAIRECASVHTEKRHLEKELEKHKDIEIQFQEVKMDNEILRTMLLRWGTIREENSFKKRRREKTIVSKTELEAILKQHYNCESIKIEKIKVGTPLTTPTFYPPSSRHTLLLDTHILIKGDVL